MSRVVTPPTSQPASPQLKVPHDKVAARAYEKWCKKGRPQQGSNVQDWLEAEAEIKAELARGATGTPPQATPPRR